MSSLFLGINFSNKGCLCPAIKKVTCEWEFHLYLDSIYLHFTTLKEKGNHYFQINGIPGNAKKLFKSSYRED